MESKTILRIKKYILRPNVVFSIIIYKLKIICRKFMFLYSAKISNGHIKHGKDIVFYQKTLITGNGCVSFGNKNSFGYILGGYHFKGICELQARYENSKIIFGNNISTNNNLLIISANEVIIGDDTLIGEGVMMIDHDGHGIHSDERRTSIGKTNPITIGKNVWIGSKSIILQGTKIGDNSIIGAGAVVKGEFPDNVIIAGNPAKIVKKI